MGIIRIESTDDDIESLVCRKPDANFRRGEFSIRKVERQTLINLRRMRIARFMRKHGKNVSCEDRAALARLFRVPRNTVNADIRAILKNGGPLHFVGV